MPLSINTNIASIAAQRSLLNSSSALETAYERLSSGKRINSAVDDAAGLAIGVDLTSRVSGLNQAVRNVNDGISMLQIAEGAYDEVTTILQRMRDIAVQGMNGSLTSAETDYLSTEHTKLASAITDAISMAKFANVELATGAVTVALQSGADSGDSINLVTGSTAVNSTANLTVSSAVFTTVGLNAIDSALDQVASHRASLGAQQAQLESTVRNLSNIAENTAAAAGRIMDTDYAAETANLTKAQILQQAATSVLAQANAQPQAVLSLLQ